MRLPWDPTPLPNLCVDIFSSGITIQRLERNTMSTGMLPNPLPRRCLQNVLAAFLFIGLATAPAWAQRTLNVGVGGTFTSLDPHFHNLTPNNIVASYIFSPLVEFDPSFCPAPALARSWTAISDTVWEFKLRSGVLWSDGSPFTPDDVVFTFSRVANVPNSPVSFTAAVKPVTQVEVVDPTTIRLHTAQPQPLLPYMLTQVLIVSRKYGQGATTEDYNTGKAAIGTGPYKLQSAVIGDHLIFRRNESWWGAEPTWAVVNYRVIANDAARTAALKVGDVDTIDQVPTVDVAGLQNNPDVTVTSVPSQRLIYIYLDSGRAQSPQVSGLDGKPLPHNPLQDRRVRKALSLAIDRERLRTQVMDGFAVPTGQLMPENASGDDLSIKPDPYDPTRARQLLAEAGYGEGFRIVLAGPNDRYVNDAAVERAVAQMWTDVGVRTEIHSTPSKTFFAGQARDDYSAALLGWASETGEAGSDLIFIVASAPRASHFSNAAIDAVIQKALMTIDVDQREDLYRQAIRMAVEQQAFIPLYHQLNIFALRKGLRMRDRMQEGIRAWEVTKN